MKTSATVSPFIILLAPVLIAMVLTLTNANKPEDISTDKFSSSLMLKLPKMQSLIKLVF